MNSEPFVIYLPSSDINSIFSAQNSRTRFLTIMHPSIADFPFNEHWHVALDALEFDYKLPLSANLGSYSDVIRFFQDIIEKVEPGIFDVQPKRKFANIFNLSISPNMVYTIKTLAQHLNSQIPEKYKNDFKIVESATGELEFSFKKKVLCLMHAEFAAWCIFQSEASMLYLNTQRTKAHEHWIHNRGVDDNMIKDFYKTNELFSRIPFNPDDYFILNLWKKAIKTTQVLPGTVKELKYNRLKAPKYFRIASNISKPCITDSGYKNEIASLPSFDEGKNYFYEIKHPEFFPLSRYRIENIEIEIRDEEFKPIPFSAGQPSLVRLKFKKMYGNQQIVKLTSNSSNHIYPSNTNSNFIVDLAHYMPPMDENWQVALSNIHFTDSIDFNVFTRDTAYEVVVSNVECVNPPVDPNAVGLNLNKFKYSSDMKVIRGDENTYEKFDFGTTEREQLKKILEAPGVTEEDVEKFLSDEVKASLRTPAEIANFIEANFKKYQLPLHVTIENDILTFEVVKDFTDGNGNTGTILKATLELNPATAYLLGATEVLLDPNETWKVVIEADKPYTFSAEVDVMRIIPQMLFVYCDIIKAVPVGSQMLQILKMVPVKLGESGTINYEIENKEFYPLQIHNINKIEISIKDAANRFFQLSKNSIVRLSLLFKQY